MRSNSNNIHRWLLGWKKTIQRSSDRSRSSISIEQPARSNSVQRRLTWVAWASIRPNKSFQHHHPTPSTHFELHLHPHLQIQTVQSLGGSEDVSYSHSSIKIIISIQRPIRSNHLPIHPYLYLHLRNLKKLTNRSTIKKFSRLNVRPS